MPPASGPVRLGTLVDEPKQLSRITLVEERAPAAASSASSGRWTDATGPSAIVAALKRPELTSYDLVAVMPQTVDTLNTCLASGLVDIICIDCEGRPDLPIGPSVVRVLYQAVYFVSSSHRPVRACSRAAPPTSPAFHVRCGLCMQYKALCESKAFLELSLGPAMRDPISRKHTFAYLRRVMRCTRGGKRLLLSW